MKDTLDNGPFNGPRGIAKTSIYPPMNNTGGVSHYAMPLVLALASHRVRRGRHGCGGQNMGTRADGTLQELFSQHTGKFFINRVPEFLLRKEGRKEGGTVQIVVPRRV